MQLLISESDSPFLSCGLAKFRLGLEARVRYRVKDRQNRGLSTPSETAHREQLNAIIDFEIGLSFLELWACKVPAGVGG